MQAGQQVLFRPQGLLSLQMRGGSHKRVLAALGNCNPVVKVITPAIISIKGKSLID